MYIARDLIGDGQVNAWDTKGHIYADEIAADALVCRGWPDRCLVRTENQLCC